MPTTTNGDVEIYYETFGDPGRPTLLLVNGLGSQCINYRVEWCEKFVAAGFHVIRFDNRDVGLSTHFHDATVDMAAVAAARAAGTRPPVPYTLSDMAADAVAVLDACAVERAHVMGLSMGGMIVQTLAIEHPDRLLSMTSVMSTTGDPEVGQASPEAQTLFAAPPPTDRDSAIQRHVDGLRVWGSPACLDEARLRREAGEAFDRSFDPVGRRRQTVAIFASGPRTEKLRSVTVPTLVIHGDADRLIDPSGGRRTAEVIPGARLLIFEGMATTTRRNTGTAGSKPLPKLPRSLLRRHRVCADGFFRHGALGTDRIPASNRARNHDSRVEPAQAKLKPER